LAAPSVQSTKAASPPRRACCCSAIRTNPIGRLYTREELDRLAAFCERHDLYVCSDEVHCDLILDEGASHVPFAKVLAERSPDLLARTITLHGPARPTTSRDWALRGPSFPDADCARAFRASMRKLVPDPCCFGFTRMKAAFEHGEPWRQALLAALRRNRDLVSAALDRMGLAHTHPDVTYLTWIDARALAAQGRQPAAWFERQGVGLSDGARLRRPATCG
jgi:cystathionine beta-lyase